jgi:hypothetical protein
LVELRPICESSSDAAAERPSHASGSARGVNLNPWNGDLLLEDQLDDATIIVRSREDRELFATVFDRQFACIHRFLGRRIGDQADDLAAEVFSIALAAD